MLLRSGFWLLLVLWSTQATARDIFVDNRAGDNRANGRFQQSTQGNNGPVRTLTRALTLAQSGDAIVLVNTGVSYRESISLVGSRCSGTSEQPFTIRGNGATLDGSRPIPSNEWKPYERAVFRFRPRLVGYQQLFLNDLPAPRVIATGKSHQPPKLAPRQWCLLDGQIYFCVEPTKLPGDYRLSCASEQTGITLFHVEHVVIADLTVQGFQLDGVSLFNSARDVSLVGVTSRGNGRCGVTVGGASLATINSSLLGDNGMAQLLTLPCSETRLRSTEILSNTGPGWLDQGGSVVRDGKPIRGGLDEFQPTRAEQKP
ncbi:MAG: right-handed parallel beta-helix repeat-containing protein [Planctomycetaceae bacterium]|nr:right-handed parallel beta-helix repeat-containing protein [Planctomycetaceae bacterium]